MSRQQRFWTLQAIPASLPLCCPHQIVNAAAHTTVNLGAAKRIMMLARVLRMFRLLRHLRVSRDAVGWGPGTAAWQRAGIMPRCVGWGSRVHDHAAVPFCHSRRASRSCCPP